MNYGESLLIAIALAGIVPATLWGADLPYCGNRVVNEVTSRVGCTVGDSWCWLTRGGFCTDYVLGKLNIRHGGKPVSWQPVLPDNVQPGDVAVFNARAHYAYVENVVKDRRGKVVAVDVSEYNFGTCLVDEDVMVTDRYNVINRRTGIPPGSVDGGFIRVVR